MMRHKLEIFKNHLENPLNYKLLWTTHRPILVERAGGSPGISNDSVSGDPQPTVEILILT